VNDQSSEVWLHGILAVEEVANDVLKTMNVRLKLKLANAVNPVLEEFFKL
jgi:succinate dehydrogenase hydrophobic anchor subunit